ncbi:hypothetical protein EJ03DRAFT_149097 [Teratosphaeria nubilosa]|uniref:Zinc finger PHD-type domain-containing protein n=1 Tax=Teratosphaeria nubilosa TaxID=161662 RepID=A0A6G1L3H0_9PEZI|nr:hypothetical protein EJ03DRAFT_149097 [Teratosphaeria nubilosa]
MSPFDSPENWNATRGKAAHQVFVHWGMRRRAQPDSSRKRRSDAIEVDGGSSARKRRPGLPSVGSFDTDERPAGAATSGVIDLTLSDGEEDRAPRVRVTSMPKSTTSMSRFTGFKMDLKPNPVKQAMVEYAKASQTPDDSLPCAPPRPMASTQTMLDMFKPEPQADSAAPAAPTQQWHTVRVGWFTGIYRTKKEAENLIIHYPYHEYAVFATFDEAKVWLRQSSTKAQRDRAIRPQNLNHIDKNAFMRFVGRSFDKHNQVPGVDERSIARKLLLLLKQACDDVRHDVNWTMQPLPQALIPQEREKVQDKPGCSASLGLWIGAKTLRPDAQQPAVHHEIQSTRSARASSPPSTVPAAASLSPPAGPLCSCGKAIVDVEIAVKCAGGDCKYELFHRTCAGFTKRDPTPGWRCWQCRPKPAGEFDSDSFGVLFAVMLCCVTLNFTCQRS